MKQKIFLKKHKKFFWNKKEENKTWKNIKTPENIFDFLYNFVKILQEIYI